MAKRTQNADQELDSTYFMKIVMYFIIGSLWVHFNEFKLIPGIAALPVGLIVGLFFVHHDHFKIDRKIEYVVLLAAAVLSYVAPIGVILQV